MVGIALAVQAGVPLGGGPVAAGLLLACGAIGTLVGGLIAASCVGG